MHFLHLPFTFCNAERWSYAPMMDGLDAGVVKELSTTMHRVWISFVRTGDPNYEGTARWDRGIIKCFSYCSCYFELLRPSI